MPFDAAGPSIIRPAAPIARDSQDYALRLRGMRGTAHAGLLSRDLEDVKARLGALEPSDKGSD